MKLKSQQRRVTKIFLFSLDAGVAGLTAESATEGAFYNVMKNLEDITDEEFKSKNKTEAIKINDEVKEITEKIRQILYKRFGL